MSPEEIEVSDGISRRRMLKRIGAGAAIAWSAPILSSIRTPASATHEQACTQCDPGQTCAACPFLAACGGSSSNQCWMASPDNGSGCTCNAFVAFCGDTPLCPGGQADCDAAGVPGYCCVQTCCGQICAPPAGSQVRRSRTKGAKTTR